MKMRLLFAATLLSLTALPSTLTAQSTEVSVDSYVESLRADLRVEKRTIVTDVMQFSDQDGKIFWPIYQRYEAVIKKINDQRVDLIKSYADKYETLTDADAKAMIDQSIDFEARRTEAKRQYAREFQSAGLSSLTVARFIQLEHRLDLLTDLAIASELPPLLNRKASQPASAMQQ